MIHSVVLWRIFGIMFEVGLPFLLIALVATALRSLISSRRPRNTL